MALCLGLAACGGGGGGGGGDAGGGDTPAALGVLKVTIVDAFGASVAGATVQGPKGSASSDEQGVALLLTEPSAGTAGVTVSRSSFVDQSVVAPLLAGQVNQLAVTLVRATSPAGGSLATRSGILPTVDSNAQLMSFEIELVAIGADSRPIENLSLANFALRACTPDPANDRIDCVSGAGVVADGAYTPATSAPAALQLISGLPATPYAAALLLDQSGSIFQSDPTGARLFSAKAFLGGLGPQDHALLAAFADGPGRLIPSEPLTVYAPFQTLASVSASPYFATLDLLATLVGGNTPLYASLDALRQRVVGDTTLPAGLAKAVVIFTDGADTRCGSPDACRLTREQSILAANQDQVRLFTIGLSSGVDVAALGELANQTGGAMFYADTAEQLLPLYGSVGKLLSLSLPTYRLRWTVQASAPGAFQPGRTLLGRVQVNTGAGSFDVPFVVGIP